MIRAGRIFARSGRFLRDEAGAVLVLWILSLVAVLAFVALIFDMGRVQVTHGELQSFADSVALAAAGELDGRADAIARATAAAAEVADTNVYGGDGVLEAGDYTLTFLTGLPEPDPTDASYNPELDSTTGYETDVDALARLVRVQVNPVSNTVNFLAATRALVGSAGGDTMATRAEAVAGFTMEACDIAPMMVCLPPGWHADDHRGDGIDLRSRGNGASWTPGEFGFLKQPLLNTGGPCEDYSGNQQDTCYLAAAGPVTKCFAQDGVDFKTGQNDGNYAAAINARFDIYLKSMGDGTNDPLFAPAPNLISGIMLSKRKVVGQGQVKCDYDTSTNTVGLPPDTCFPDGDCPSAFGGRFGDGNWDRKKYFGVNYLGESRYQLDDDGNVVTHNGKQNGIPVDRTDFSDVDLSNWATELPGEMVQWFNANGRTPLTATRWETYQSENAVTGNILDGLDETGRPQCNLTNNNDVDIYRRTIIVAGVVCTDAAGNSLYQGSADNVPVEEFVQVFLTNPAIEGATEDKFNFYGEVIQSVGKKGYGGAGDGGKFRDVVQLYR
jgi:hypothetical protein